VFLRVLLLRDPRSRAFQCRGNWTAATLSLASNAAVL
jgi:hypothetical protein